MAGVENGAPLQIHTLLSRYQASAGGLHGFQKLVLNQVSVQLHQRPGQYRNRRCGGQTLDDVTWKSSQQRKGSVWKRPCSVFLEGKWNKNIMHTTHEINSMPDTGHFSPKLITFTLTLFKYLHTALSGFKKRPPKGNSKLRQKQN